MGKKREKERKHVLQTIHERVIYLGVKPARVVHKRQADVVQTTNFTCVVAKALKHATADIPRRQEAVLDVSYTVKHTHIVKLR